MKDCKPCITIRQITKIIYNNIKLAYKKTKEDIESYSRVNATACKLDIATPMTTEHHMNAAKRIRELYKDDPL
jgi:hypothetical protein